MSDDRPPGPVEPPEVPRHVHRISKSGQITIPIDLREQFDTDEFCVFTDPDDEQIHLEPVNVR